MIIPPPKLPTVVPGASVNVKPAPEFKTQVFWATEIMQRGTRLTPWENEFMKSIARQLKFKAVLTPLQLERLEKLYADKTPL